MSLTTAPKEMTMFIMPKLRYDPEDLSPNISKETFEFHFGKHTKSYIDNVNKLINLPTGQHFKNMTLEGIICESNGALYNNASQVWNHTFYWLGLNPLSRRVTLESRSTLDAAIKHNFGDTKHFKEQFKASATSLFGSGWTWLAKDNSGKLFFVNTTNGDGLLKSDSIPLVVCDVWEHAYYIDYRNDRGRYFDQFF
jgi:Fe-Mn family superoxide dismutase